LKAPEFSKVFAAVACAAAAALSHPLLSGAFVTAWPVLDDDRRFVRVFNNFSDAQSNDAVALDANWPGFAGAPRAIWKGAAEWASRPHPGLDPLQPDGIGSGGAQLDALFLGLAPNTGFPNDNVASELNGNNAGVIAFTELPPNDGWRIRFYANPWIFDDDPAGPAAGAIDLQAVMAHEYGHALGLDHTPVAGATMEAAPADITALRSLEADDIAGVQFLYGVAAPNKPRIEALTLDSSGQLVLLGEHFSTSNQLELQGQTLSGLSSSAAGRVLSVLLNPSPTAGDLQLSWSSGPALGAAVSNAWPLDPAACAPPGRWCVGKTNSQGCVAQIGFSGSPSVAAGGFAIHAAQVLNQKSGFLIYGFAPAATPFQGGTLCLANPLKRTPPSSSGGSTGPANCSGSLSYDFGARLQSGVDPLLTAGKAVYAQYIYRDPADSSGWGLSDALAFTICP
jgi:hypothetical protein